MGWKAATIFMIEKKGASLASFPKHQSTKAIGFLDKIGRIFRDPKPASFERGIFPPPGKFSVGAYNDMIVFSDSSHILGSIADNSNQILENILNVNNSYSMLIIELQDTINHFAYSYYESGALIRAYGGNAEKGIFVDFGVPLEEELPFFNASTIIAGRRVFHETFDGISEELDEIMFGEKLVFSICKRVLGMPLNEYPAHKLEMEMFADPWLKRFFGVRFDMRKERVKVKE